MLKKCFFIISIYFIYANAYEYYKRDEIEGRAAVGPLARVLFSLTITNQMKTDSSDTLNNKQQKEKQTQCALCHK